MIWGYATTSTRSALFMRAIDSLPSVKKTTQLPRFEGTTVVSSIAGLGDLIIQLPLIAGLVNKTREFGTEPTVALRPAHLNLGEVCGWKVMEFENPLVDFFGQGLSLAVLKKSARALIALRQRKVDTWIDLTGNAFNASAIRMGGVHSLFSAVSRGGKSLVHGEIPHRPYENEYGFRDKLATHFNCELDFSIYQKLADVTSSDDIVLSITTYNQWKSWPLSYFAEVVRAFPSRQFILVGATKEIPAHELADWVVLRDLPNTRNLLDSLDLLQFAKCIASAGIFVGNDSGGAHLANAFKKPGAVIFGPTISETWHGNSMLRLFHDRSCPYYPCRVRRCDQQQDWCMKRIAPTEVIEHMRTLLS